jgi:hypothetical protein
MSWSWVWLVEVNPLAEGNGNIKQKTVRVVAANAQVAMDIVAARYQDLNESAVEVRCLGQEHAVLI